MPKLREIVKTKNKQSIWLSIPELTVYIQSAYEWEHFCDIPENIVTDWIVRRYGWTEMFSTAEAKKIVEDLINSGWNFND